MTSIQGSANTSGASPEVFWGEIAPYEHLVQIYTNTGAFLDSLVGFVGGGLQSGDGVIVVATTAHLVALHERLTDSGFNLSSARARDQYISMDAREALEQFMDQGWPNTENFENFVLRMLERARGTNRRVRVFGEMVAVLWASGQSGATHRLEQLWHRLCANDGFSLFCAYPRAGFTQDMDDSLQAICDEHSRIVGDPPGS